MHEFFSDRSFEALRITRRTSNPGLKSLDQAVLQGKLVDLIAEWLLPRKSALDAHTLHSADDKQAKTSEHLLLRLCFASVLPTQIGDLDWQCNAVGNSQSAAWVGSNAFPLPICIECICNARGPPPRQRTPCSNIRALALHTLHTRSKQTPRLSRCVSIAQRSASFWAELAAQLSAWQYSTCCSQSFL